MGEKKEINEEIWNGNKIKLDRVWRFGLHQRICSQGFQGQGNQSLQRQRPWLLDDGAGGQRLWHAWRSAGKEQVIIQNIE